MENPFNPDVQTPEQPQYEAPQYQAPEQPQYRPQYQAPEQPQYQPQYQAPEQPQYQPQYQAPEQPQYQPQYQAPEQPQYQPQYQAPEQPQYQAPQYQPPQHQQVYAPKAESGSRKGTILSCIGFGCALLALSLAFVFALKFSDGEEAEAMSVGIAALVFSILGFDFGIAGLATHGKKAFALIAVIFSATISIAAIIFIFDLIYEIYDYLGILRHSYYSWY